MRPEEKGKRRAKRKAKQVKAREGRTQLPRFIACHYLKDNIHPDHGILLDAFECARDRSHWMELPYRLLTDVKPCHCWVNVEVVVARWGGRMVCGWSFRIDPLEGFTNCMADIEARPHAVWSDDDGKLWEVSPDCRGAFFLPSDRVRPYMALNVGFADNEFQARTYRPPDPFLEGHPLIGNIYISVGSVRNDE